MRGCLLACSFSYLSLKKKSVYGRGALGQGELHRKTTLKVKTDLFLIFVFLFSHLSTSFVTQVGNR